MNFFLLSRYLYFIHIVSVSTLGFFTRNGNWYQAYEYNKILLHSHVPRNVYNLVIETPWVSETWLTWNNCELTYSFKYKFSWWTFMLFSRDVCFEGDLSRIISFVRVQISSFYIRADFSWERVKVRLWWVTPSVSFWNRLKGFSFRKRTFGEFRAYRYLSEVSWRFTYGWNTQLL